MGGYGSGPYGTGGHVSKIRVGQCKSLDIRNISRKGLLNPGQSYVWAWWYGKEKKEAGKIGVHINEGSMRMHYTITELSNGEKREINYAIPIDRTKCNYGGERSWLICPKCGKRVAKVYLKNDYFLCRTCQDLTYRSCQVAGDICDMKRSRAERIMKKLQAKDIYDLDTIPARPKGMHRKTYDRLLNMLYRAIDDYNQTFMIQARRLLMIGE